jgi:hypothetical protein
MVEAVPGANGLAIFESALGLETLAQAKTQ